MLAVREYDIRKDGSWRQDARPPTHPGVIVSANTKYGPMKWVCDEFTVWGENIHAIALTLERLRLSDLYGVTKRGAIHRMEATAGAVDNRAADDGGGGGAGDVCIVRSDAFVAHEACD